MTTNNDNQLIKSVTRALRLIEIIVDENDPLGVTDISEKAELHKSTVYRILNTLIHLGYVNKNENGKYYAGLKLFEVGSKAINDLDLRQTVAPYLRELMNITGETIHLGILDNNEIVYIDKVESDKTIRMHSKVGKRVYAHSTSLGKVILAHLSKEEIKKTIQHQGLPELTSNTITDYEELQKHLEEVRKQGYAIDDEENEMGIRCIAGPIFNHEEEIMAAFSISGPALRLTREKILDFRELVKKYTKKISGALGYNNINEVLQ